MKKTEKYTKHVMTDDDRFLEKIDSLCVLK